MAVKIEHRVGVQAPAERIWEIVADVEAWRDWNPLYPSAEGAIRIGAPLTLELALPGQKPRVIRPVVADWVPNEQLIWRLTLVGGLVRSTRFIEIEALTETGCILANGEIFDGLLGPSVAGRMRPAIRAGFQAMGEALKTRAEAAWRAAAS